MPETARQVLDRHTSEADFMDSVIELAQRTGWKVMHVPDKLYKLAAKEERWDAMPGAEDFPDLLMVHPQRGQLCVLECKDQRGRVTEGQREWLSAFYGVLFRMAGLIPKERHKDFYALTWIDFARPSDWDRVEAFLTGETHA